MAHSAPLLLLALGALLACCAGQDDALRWCYSCALTDGDDTCLEDPNNAGISPVVDCTLEPNNCCLIQRVDDNDNLGTPLSFARLCTKNCDPDKLGQMIETVETSYTTYQTYCNELMCNDGPGNVSLGQDDVLQCYSCVLTDGDDSCLNDPDNAGNSSVVDCTLEPNKCCLIQRVDDNENLGTPLSFARLCTKNCDPDKLGQMIENVDSSYTTYQTYCNEPKCNDGPGNVSLGQDDVLQCYSCVLTDGDDSCLNDPDNAGNSSVVDCTLEPNKCCLIQRVDDNENLGTPLSFARLCSKNCDPDKLGQMIETVDSSYTTYQTYCNEYKCNDGPGNVSIGGSGGESAANTFTAMTPAALLLLLALDPRGR